MADTPSLLKRQAEALIPTAIGDLKVMAYAVSIEDHMPHLVIAHPDAQQQGSPIVRIHSECITGDIFGSNRCDCGEQLNRALAIISREKGLLIYLRQEGRGIGIINKLKAYNLQDQGLNTVDANIHMGFEADEREYSMAITILTDLGISSIRLLTNNPEKMQAFEDSGIDLREHLPLEIHPNESNYEYLKTKQHLMGHMLHIKDR